MTFDSWLQAIEELSELGQAQTEGFVPLEAKGADIHGSLVWTCVREDAGIVRYAAFSATERGAGGGLAVEVEAGLDTQSGYRRKSVASYQISDIAGLPDLIRSRAAKDFRRALSVARKMRPADLTPRMSLKR